MIVYGGMDCNESTFYNDVWVLTNANGLGGTPAWTRLAPAGVPPSDKLGFSAVYDPTSNEMIVFGGDRSANILILSHANGLGGTPAWTELTPAGGAIPPRYEHTAVYDPASNRMAIFGGGGLGSQLNDTWVLANANNSGGTPTWTQLAPSGTIPPARQGQTAVLDPTTNRMIVFGGASGEVGFNDTWALSNNVTPSISNLTPNFTTAGGPQLTLTVNGQGFVAGAAVEWNGSALTTTFVSAAQLTAAVGANLIAAAGTASVTVVSPGGAASAPATFTINPAQPTVDHQ